MTINFAASGSRCVCFLSHCDGMPGDEGSAPFAIWAIEEQLLKCFALHFFLSKNETSNVRSSVDADCFSFFSPTMTGLGSIWIPHRLVLAIFFENHSMCQISEGTLVSRFVYFPETGDPLLKLLFKKSLCCAGEPNGSNSKPH